MLPKLILLDADGVLWRGREVIPAAPGFIRRAQAAGIRTVLVSNNAGPNREAYYDKCRRLDLAFTPQDIFSVNHLAGPYIAEHYPGRQAFVLGSEMLVAEMRKHTHATSAEEWLVQQGISSHHAVQDDLRLATQAEFDLVVVGIDVNVTYLKLAIASVLLQRGAPLIAGNPDITFPIEYGLLLPGCGSIVALLARVCGVQPVYLGKPELHLLTQIERETGIGRQDMLMIGDRPETDYEFARRAGIPCCLVLTGVTPPAQMPPAGPGLTIHADLDDVARHLGW